MCFDEEKDKEDLIKISKDIYEKLPNLSSQKGKVFCLF